MRLALPLLALCSRAYGFHTLPRAPQRLRRPSDRSRTARSGTFLPSDPSLVAGVSPQANATALYADVDFWNEYYGDRRSSADFFEWFDIAYDELDGTLRSALAPGQGPADSRVLHVGCGNSRLSEEMNDDGYVLLLLLLPLL